MAQIDNCDKIIDSRDIIERIEELQQEREALENEVAECEEAYKYHDSDDTKSTPEWHALQDAYRELDNWNESDEAEELKSLEAFAEEASQYSSDWEHGETLINESYWVDYCKELVSDIGDMPREIPSYIEIDWEATADNIAADYTQVDFDGTTFFMRNN